MELLERQHPEERELEEARSKGVKEQNWERKGSLPFWKEEDMGEDNRTCLPFPVLLVCDRTQAPETSGTQLDKAVLAWTPLQLWKSK